MRKGWLAAIILSAVMLMAAVTTIDLVTQVKGILPVANGGTGIAYFGVTGPTAARSYTFPDADAVVSRMVAGGTAALGTSSIAANSCATVVTDGTVTAGAVANVLTTDIIQFTPNADISGVTGYTPGGTLKIIPYPTAGHVNFKVCNADQSNAVVPGAVTLNWRVSR